MELCVQQGKRDLRTTEAGRYPRWAVLCAERTMEYPMRCEEGKNAVFWKDAAEYAALCKELLSNEPRRREIARRGHERALKNGHYNEAVMAKILDVVRRIFPESR